MLTAVVSNGNTSSDHDSSIIAGPAAKRVKSSSTAAKFAIHHAVRSISNRSFSTSNRSIAESSSSDQSNIATISNNLAANFDFSHGDHPLFRLVVDSAQKHRRIVTYDDFDRTIRKYVAYFRGNFKLRKGDRVACQTSKSIESLAIYVACLRLGAVYVPLNTDYKNDEIRYFLLNSEPSVFVCRRRDLETYEKLFESGPLKNSATFDCRLIDEDRFAQEIDRSEGSIGSGSIGSIGGPIDIEKVHPDDLAAICYTSGTTGQPKGAMITHGNLISNSRALCDLWRIDSSDVLLHSMPIYHVHGLFVATNTILSRGASMYFLPRFDSDIVLDVLPECSLMMGVPTYYTRLLATEKFTKELVRGVRLFVSGSAPLLEGTWREFEERTGKQILERYGMTEGQMICSNPYDGTRRPGTVGRPLPGVSVRIRNSSLQYKGPNVFKGYWRMPEKTRDEFTDDGYFISGDLAEIDPTDGYVRIMGRGKDLIITGGLNVYPKEIENAIDSLAGVVESAVIAVPHRDFGEAVVAVVVVAPNDQNRGQQREQGGDEQQQREKAMIGELKSRIAAFKVPKRIFCVDQLPRNVMGKVQKNVLRETYKKAFDN